MKDVIGYEDLFAVTEDGRLWSKRTSRFLTPQKNSKGYICIASRIGGRQGKAVLFRLHRLVAEAYISNPENKTQVNHKDGNKLNNHVSNLEWVTGKENVQHAYATGLAKCAKGFDNKLSKLTKEDVTYIKSNYIPYSRTFGSRALSRKFDIDHMTILDIIGNIRYKEE